MIKRCRWDTKRPMILGRRLADFPLVLLTLLAKGARGFLVGTAIVLAASQAEASDVVRIAVLSSPPYAVSGGDALVQIEVSQNTPGARLSVLVNGANLSAAFIAAGTQKWIGKISNLRLGANEVTARYGKARSTLVLTNFPAEGPILSGPHEIPFICDTSLGVPGGGALVRIPNDPNCGVVTQVDYLYSNAPNKFAVLKSRTTYPADIRNITINGRTVPYVVRIETGTINRAIYQSALLHDVVNEPAPAPLARPAGWNGKLIYRFAGGCDGGWFHQGSRIVSVLDDHYLARGFAVATSTLNVMGQNCNDQLAAETVMMVKERFIESYGAPLFTIGIGSSGGAYQSVQIGDNYPGLLDGIIIGKAFADVVTCTLFKFFDARLLKRYFDNAPSYTDSQKLAISGFLQVGHINKASDEARRIDPTASFPRGVNAGNGSAFRYDPLTNRGGARASVYDHTRNVYGVNAEGHVNRPIDNVGVQYGLNALNAGQISITQFLDLNKRIGGLDRDLKWTSQRTVADMDAVTRAYQSGRIVWGGGGLASMPIIDRRNYEDNVVRGSIHNKIHSFSLRERLRAANGHADNHVILTFLRGDVGIDTLSAMDRWLSAIKADEFGVTLSDKVIRHRPSDLVDGCWIKGKFVAETQTAHAPGACNREYPAGTTPRMVAGGPIADDIVKCALKPLLRTDYKVSFTPSEWGALQSIFPSGVCDWSRPGVNQVPSLPWRSFGPSTTNLLFDITKR